MCRKPPYPPRLRQDSAKIRTILILRLPPVRNYPHHPCFTTRTRSSLMPHAGCLLPVTAVTFANIEHEHNGSLVLAAEGPYVRVFSLKPRLLLLTRRIFHAQTIHGIRCITNNRQHEGETSVFSNLNVLAWGGRQITLAVLTIRSSDNGPQVSCSLVQPAQVLDDYILDACRSVHEQSISKQPTVFPRVYAVTVYNQLFSLSFSLEAVPDEQPLRPTLIAHGPSCALYSAHIEVLDSRSLLVAAGTVFGIVHVWQSSTPDVSSTSIIQANTTLVRSLHGHEGSVFGVRLFQFSHSPVSGFVVASCSDDRTIRIWSLPELESSFKPSTTASSPAQTSYFASTGFTGTAISHLTRERPFVSQDEGHASRIWSIRFHKDLTGRPSLLSFGEDATAQIWQLVQASSSFYKSEGLVGLEHSSVHDYHVGKNIWAAEIASDDSGLIITGGADGRLVLSKLEQRSRGWVWTSAQIDDGATSPKKLDGDLAAPHDFESNRRPIGNNHTSYCEVQVKSQLSFKAYCWLGETSLLACTSDGRICLGKLRLEQANGMAHHKADRNTEYLSMNWTCLASIDDLSSFALMTCLPGKVALLSGVSGVIYIYVEQRRLLRRLLKLPRKLGFLCAQNVLESESHQFFSTAKGLAVVAVCLGGKKAYVFPIGIANLSSEEDPTTSLRSVTLLPGFVVTSASYLSESLLALGSRSGALALYDVSNLHKENGMSPIAIKEQIHGEDSITSILNLSRNDSIFILTTGRDGHFAAHKIRHVSSKALMFETVHRVRLPMGPYIEGAALRTATRDLVLWGFQGRRFVLWNYTKQQSIMTIDCGGFHRSWNFLPGNSTSGAGNLVWTQASECRVYRQADPSHEILQPGLHGREIKAIAVCQQADENGGYMVATGAEDTTIRISKYLQNRRTQLEQPLRCIATVYDHVTGIQKLLWSPDGQYLFSAAGKEEFRVWRVQSAPCIEIGIVEVAYCHTVSDSGDLRIMDFDCVAETSAVSESGSLLLIMGYSDSSIRLWRFNPARPSNRLECLTTTVYSTVCITQCQFLSFNSSPFILSCASNGSITLWQTKRAPKKYSDNQLNDQDFLIASRRTDITPETSWTLSLIKSTRVHQCSIKSAAFKIVSPICTVIITGGDDNAIGITYATVEAVLADEKPHTAFVTLFIPKAHAAAINGLCLIPSEQHKEAATENGFSLISASNDQHLKTWAISLNAPEGASKLADSIRVRKVNSEESSIADVACLDLIQGSNKLFVAGIGVEVWDLENIT